MAWLSLEELKKYDAKKELKKMGQAEKSATLNYRHLRHFAC